MARINRLSLVVLALVRLSARHDLIRGDCRSLNLATDIFSEMGALYVSSVCTASFSG